MSASSAEPLPWPMIPGSPADLAWAKMRLDTAILGDYFPALDEYRAAQRRHAERNERLIAHREATIRSVPATCGAEHEIAYYGGAV